MKALAKKQQKGLILIGLGIVGIGIAFGLSKKVIKKLKYHKSKETMQRVINQWGVKINKYASRYGLDPHLVAAVVTRESAGDANAKGGSGEYGLMQLMPGTYRDMVGNQNLREPIYEAYDPDKNLNAGCKYLRKQIDRCNDVTGALTNYNRGPGAGKCNVSFYATDTLNLVGAVARGAWNV